MLRRVAVNISVILAGISRGCVRISRYARTSKWGCNPTLDRDLGRVVIMPVTLRVVTLAELYDKIRE